MRRVFYPFYGVFIFNIFRVMEKVIACQTGRFVGTLAQGAWHRFIFRLELAENRILANYHVGRPGGL